jgi:hypothetical protein
MYRVIATMSTFKQRSTVVADSVESILPQVDELWIYVNDYNNIQAYVKKHDKIKIFLGSQCEGDIKAKGKFYNSHLIDGYHFTVDDDIIYPKDYVSRYLHKLQEYNNNIIVTSLGKIVKPNSRNYYKDYLYSNHFQRIVDCDQLVHLGGTGVMAYHTDYFKVDYNAIKTGTYVDLFIGIQANLEGRPILCLKHEENWLKHNIKSNHTLMTSLYNSGLSNFKPQTELMNSIYWPPIEIIDTVKINRGLEISTIDRIKLLEKKVKKMEKIIMVSKNYVKKDIKQIKRRIFN